MIFGDVLMSYNLNAMNGLEAKPFKQVNNGYAQILETKIRDESTSEGELKESLFKLGAIVGQEICVDNFLSDVTVKTPMEATYSGVKIDESKEYVVISTKDEYEYFALGIARQISDCYRGYIEFIRGEGKNDSCAPIRTISLPEIKTGKPVEYVIIAKSVLATGCTAISLAKKALEKYMANGIIIASVFYSERGVLELKKQIPHAKIYVCTSPDKINDEGMLLPGIGDIDLRMSVKPIET
jgi:uracil phosphoribosyltransferase